MKPTRYFGQRGYLIDRIRVHWIWFNKRPHHYWCNCMPGFRIGPRVVYPKRLRGSRNHRSRRRRTFVCALLHHQQRNLS